MNPGGVRGSLLYASSIAGEGDGVVTFGEAFTVQPFGNSLQTLSLTGAQIDLMLEQQFCGVNSPFAPTTGFFKILLPSAGFSYTWDNAVANASSNARCATVFVRDGGRHHRQESTHSTPGRCSGHGGCFSAG